MQIDVEYEQLQDLLELKKANVLQETLERLNRELAAYGDLNRLIAFAKSKEATDELGLTMPPAEENGEDVSAVEELTRRRRLLMDAMRATVYVAANRLKQYTQQERTAAQKNAEDATEEAQEE